MAFSRRPHSISTPLPKRNGFAHFFRNVPSIGSIVRLKETVRVDHFKGEALGCKEHNGAKNRAKTFFKGGNR